MNFSHSLVLVFSVLSAVTSSFGQSQRLILVEHFTQASCFPCENQDPELEEVLDNNAGTVIAVKHQLSFPGNDPMNAHYPEGPDDRQSFYGIIGTPTSVLDGNQNGPGSPSLTVTDANIATRAAVDAPFTLDVSHTISGGDVNVSVDATCTQAVSGNLNLFIAVVENEINFTSPPGANGQTEFTNVLKQYLGGTSGTGISGNWTIGDNNIYNESWTMSNVYDEGQLAIVAWIQDTTTKEVHQAGYSAPIPEHNLNAMTFSVSGVPGEVCDGTINPTVLIKNGGGDDLTSLIIDYDVNGTASQFNWAGNIPFLSEEQVTLPSLNFGLQANNTLTISLSSPNGGADQEPSNNQISLDFLEAKTSSSTDVTVTITPDSFGSENSWEIKSSSGTVVGSGGPYTNGQTAPQVSDVSLPADDCYEFILYDSHGDGMCCLWGSGAYEVQGDGVSLVSGPGSFTYELSRYFEVDQDGNAELNSVTENDFLVYPNPVDDILHVELPNMNSAKVSLKDLQGRNVAVGEGSNISFPIGHLTSGSYLLIIIGEEGTYTRNVVIR